MRFGHDLHRHIIPEWSQNYADYNLMKRLTKCSDTQEVCAYINSSTLVLNMFFQLRLEELDAAEVELCELFGLEGENHANPDIAGTCRAELTFLIEACSGIRQDLKKLHWYLRVNTEALERILDKLIRQGQAEDSSFRYSQGRWHQVQPSWESRLLNRLDRLEGLMTDISSHLNLSERSAGDSLYLARAFRQNPCPSLATDAVHQALQAGDTTRVLQLLICNSKPDMSEPSFLALILDLLKFSVMFVPTQFGALLALLPSPEQSVIEQDVLKWSITTIGQRQQSDSNAEGVRAVFAAFEVYKCRISNVLQAKDRSDRLPLHYAASYRLPLVCQELLRALVSSSTVTDFAIEAVLSADNEGRTPLHLAVMGNCTATATRLIEFIAAGTRLEESSRAKATMGDVLHIALKTQNDEIVCSLLHAHADVCFQSSRGETALHVAAQLGRADYASLVLDAVAAQGAKFDVVDTSRGWTPLFFACRYGHYSIVELLLQAGSSQTRTDHLGWTAKEHAAFKGHLAVAELFEASDSRDLTGGPARPSAIKSSHASLHCEGSERIIVASLGTNRTDRVVTELNLSYCSSKYIPGAYESLSFALEVSAPGSACKPRRVRLPILDDHVNDPFVFPIPGTIEPQLMFKIIRLTGSGEEMFVGSGTALLESNNRQLGAQRQSIVRDQTVPILDKDTMSVSGTVTFASFIAKSFPHLQTPQLMDLSRKSPMPPLLVGHRGAGQNVDTHDHLQLGENTVASFLSAAKLGASFVEFDVQVTRDLEAVAFHDFSLSESGTDVAVHNLTLDQFLHASNIQSPHGNPLSTLGQVHSRMEPGRPRSRSLGRQFEAGAIQIRDRMKHTVDFKVRGFKPNTRGDFIQDSFATLKEILIELPKDIGCDVEIKLPRFHETVDAGIAPVAIELNTFVDVALDVLHRHAGQRQIILSSFTPEICILLSMKQKAYPVFFITNAGKVPMFDMEVRAASVQVAVRFARRWNLAGVVFACEALLLCPRLVGFMRAKGLVCATYGLLNNEPDMIKLQVEAGVDIVVADRVGLIAQTLAAMSVPDYD